MGQGKTKVSWSIDAGVVALVEARAAVEERSVSQVASRLLAGALGEGEPSEGGPVVPSSSPARAASSGSPSPSAPQAVDYQRLNAPSAFRPDPKVK